MNNFNGEERRRHPRLNASYVLSYRAIGAESFYDFTQTKNVSQGGMSFSTDKLFDKGMSLIMSMRWPFSSKRVEIKGEVVESREVSPQYSLCETQIRFVDMPEDESAKIGDFILQRLHR